MSKENKEYFEEWNDKEPDWDSIPAEFCVERGTISEALFVVLVSKGYKFKGDRTDDYGNRYFDTGSIETSNKVEDILCAFYYSDIYYAMTTAREREIREAIGGNFNSFDDSDTHYLENMPEPDRKRVLEECFVRRFEDREKRSKDLKTIALRDGLKTSPEMEAKPEDRDYYEELKSKGVRPITQEAAALMFYPIVEDLIEDYPELAP